jgi:hypothetical protein
MVRDNAATSIASDVKRSREHEHPAGIAGYLDRAELIFPCADVVADAHRRQIISLRTTALTTVRTRGVIFARGARTRSAFTRGPATATRAARGRDFAGILNRAGRTERDQKTRECCAALCQAHHSMTNTQGACRGAGWLGRSSRAPAVEQRQLLQAIPEQHVVLGSSKEVGYLSQVPQLDELFANPGIELLRDVGGQPGTFDQLLHIDEILRTMRGNHT